MDYKEKYEQALERAKAWSDCEHATTDDKILLKRIFPELKESEDENIRKTLLESFYSYKDEEWIRGIKVKDVIAWLEKQGETFTKKDVDDAYLKGVTDTKKMK